MTELESSVGLTDPVTLHSKGKVLFDLLVFKKKGKLEVASLHCPTGKVDYLRLVIKLNEILPGYVGLLNDGALGCARVMDIGGVATTHLFERVAAEGPTSVFDLRASFQLGDVPEIVNQKTARRESLLAKIYREGLWDGY